jgi:hypothetical protein
MNKTEYPRNNLRDNAAEAKRQEREHHRELLRAGGSADLCTAYYKGLFCGYKCAEISLQYLNHSEND